MADHEPQQPVYSARGNYGKLAITPDPDFYQLWVRTDYNHKVGNGATVNLSPEMVVDLRDSLNRWLEGK